MHTIQNAPNERHVMPHIWRPHSPAEGLLTSPEPIWMAFHETSHWRILQERNASSIFIKVGQFMHFVHIPSWLKTRFNRRCKGGWKHIIMSSPFFHKHYSLPYTKKRNASFTVILNTGLPIFIGKNKRKSLLHSDCVENKPVVWTLVCVITVWLSGGSKVSKVTRLWAWQSAFIILAGARDFSPYRLRGLPFNRKWWNLTCR